MTLCIHQERIILVGINVGIIDCFVEKAKRTGADSGKTEYPLARMQYSGRKVVPVP
jgi:hypothetical protein